MHLIILHLRLHVRLEHTSNIIYIDFVQFHNCIFYNHGIICIDISADYL